MKLDDSAKTDFSFWSLPVVPALATPISSLDVSEPMGSDLNPLSTQFFSHVKIHHELNELSGQ